MTVIRGLVINTQSVDSNGDVVKDPSGNPAGSVLVAGAIARTEQNRIIPSVAQIHPGNGATNVATWSSGEDIHYLIIPPDIRFVVNAASDADAKLLLDAVGGAAVTVVGGRSYSESYIYSQKTAIIKLDMKSMSGADQTNVFIGASS